MKKTIMLFIFITYIFILNSSIIFNESFNVSSPPTGWVIQGYEDTIPKTNSDFFVNDSGNNVLRLTENAINQRSSAFFTAQSVTNIGWTLTAEIRIGLPDDNNLNQSGEGMTFVWFDARNLSVNSQLIGSADGVGVGEQGSPLGLDGYGVEFDHFKSAGEDSKEYAHIVRLADDFSHYYAEGSTTNYDEEDFSSNENYYYKSGWINVKIECTEHNDSEHIGEAKVVLSWWKAGDPGSSKTWYIDKDPNYGPQIDEAYETFPAFFGITGATPNNSKTSTHDIRNFKLEGVEQALPVTLSSFTATYFKGNAQLQWITQSESNNLGWNIYRNTNDNPEEAVQINYDLIPGSGTTTDVTNYNYFDESIDFLIDTNYLQNGDNVWYWLESRSVAGSSELFDPVVMTINNPGQEDPTPDIPDNLGLMQNYPNPFNPDTYISFNLKEGCDVELTIFNTKGQKIKTLFQGFAEGDTEYPHTFNWDGTNNDGSAVESGVYLYRLKSKKGSVSKKMILMQ